MDRARELRILVFAKLIFFLLSLGVVWAQDSGEKYNLKKMIFIPPKFYVGDEVELRLEIVPQGGIQLKLPVSIDYASLNISKWLRINKIKVERANSTEYTVRVFFVSFQPGTQVLPDIDLGKFKIRNIQVYTDTVLSPNDNSDLELFRDRLFLPHTLSNLVFVVLLVIGSPIILILLFVYLRRLIIYLILRLRSKKPFIYASLNIKRLEKEIGKIHEKQFYSEATRILKLYLSLKYGKNFDAFTTMELKEAIEEIIGNKNILVDFCRLLAYSDGIKFEGKNSTEREMREFLSKVAVIIKKMEEFTPVVES